MQISMDSCIRRTASYPCLDSVPHSCNAMKDNVHPIKKTQNQIMAKCEEAAVITLSQVRPRFRGCVLRAGCLSA